MKKVIVFTTETCPKCNQLKKYLSSHKIPFEEAEMSTPEALTELRFNGVFSLTAPVLQINDIFLTTAQIFDENSIREGIEHLVED